MRPPRFVIHWGFRISSVFLVESLGPSWKALRPLNQEVCLLCSFFCMWKHKQTQSHSWDDWDKLGENNGMKIEDSGDFILNTVCDQLPKKVCKNGLQFHYKIQSHPTHGSKIQKYWARLNPAHFANLHLLDTDPSLNLFWLPTQKNPHPGVCRQATSEDKAGHFIPSMHLTQL